MKYILILFCLSWSAISAQTTLNGTIQTAQGEGICEVTVELLDASDVVLAQTQTDSSGNYTLTLSDENIDYLFRVNRDIPGTAEKGVSTTDLVLISRHIMGIDNITSPEILSAMDVNGSGSATTFDIVQIRKVLLGLDSAFIAPNWLFYTNTESVTSSEDAPNIFALNGATTFDLIGYKTGDVDLSVRGCEE